MKKELHPGVIAGILAVVVVVVVVLAWRAVAPPGPAGIKPFTKESWKEAMQKHSESAAAIRQQQMELYKQAHGGNGQ